MLNKTWLCHRRAWEQWRTFSWIWNFRDMWPWVVLRRNEQSCSSFGMEWGAWSVSVLSLSVSLSPIPTSLSVRHIPTCAWTHHTMLKSVFCIVCLTARKILLISVMGHFLSSHRFPYYSASEELILPRDNENLKSNQKKIDWCLCVCEGKY
jgi:hypothetical protein